MKSQSFDAKLISMILYRKYHVGVFFPPYQLAQPRLGDEFYRGDVLKSTDIIFFKL